LLIPFSHPSKGYTTSIGPDIRGCMFLPNIAVSYLVVNYARVGCEFRLVYIHTHKAIMIALLIYIYKYSVRDAIVGRKTNEKSNRA